MLAPVAYQIQLHYHGARVVDTIHAAYDICFRTLSGLPGQLYCHIPAISQQLPADMNIERLDGLTSRLVPALPGAIPGAIPGSSTATSLGFRDSCPMT